MKHHRLKELFTGRKNIFTVMLVLLGGYFIAYPTLQIVTHKVGNGWTIVIGFTLLIIGDFLMDAFHRNSNN